MKAVLKVIIKKTLKVVINVFRFIDSHFLYGFLKKKYSRYKLTHGEQLYNLNSLIHRRFKDGKKIKVLAIKRISIRDIFLAQYYNHNFTEYKHYDSAVRLLAIEEYYGKKTSGFYLYQKLQSASGFDWTTRFQSLIASYEQNGYREDSIIELDRNLCIMDGSHRITLAYYMGQEFINATIYNTIRNRIFDIDFFWKNHFTAKECAIISEKMNEILDKCNYDFIGVIWPPAIRYSDEIINDISKYDPPAISIRETKDIHLEKGDFIHLFKALYHTDILNEDGMNLKINQINNCLPSDCNNYPIKMFKLRIKNPHMGINSKNLTSQSQYVKRIKTVFRSRYKDKIPNYQYDVVMHIADNYLQSKFCETLFKIDRDISEAFKNMDSDNYVVIRAKESRQHSNFPANFYLGGDSDIIVKSQDLDRLLSQTYKYSVEHFNYPWISIDKVQNSEENKVIIKLLDFMIFQFEFILRPYGLDQGFADICLSHRIKEQVYFILPEYDEIIIRIAEYMHKPKKKWHIEYIIKHFNHLDEKRLYDHLNKKEISEQKVRGFLSEIKEKIRSNDQEITEHI